MSKIRLNGIALILLVTIIIFLSAKQADAIGVSPGRTTINFLPQAREHTVDFKVINNNNKAIKAIIFVRGELNQSVTLHDSIIELNVSESKSFKYDVKLPANLASQPGLHDAEIVIMEIPDVLSGQTVIGANTAVVTQLHVNVAFPGKFARASLEISEAQVGEDIIFLIPILNLGEENINKASATIDILGPTNEKLSTVNTDEKAVESKNRRDLTAKWKADVNPGVYHAVAVVNYDGELIRIERNFGVGNLLIDISDVKVKNFKLGGIAKFEISLENKWNQKIDGIFADMIMSDEDGDEVATFRSEPKSIEPLGKEMLFAYWDTEGIDEGVYDAKVILHYEGKTTEKHLRAFVSLDGIRVDLIGATAQAVAVGGLFKQSILGLLVIILIIINIGWFWYFSRRNKKGNIGGQV